MGCACDRLADVASVWAWAWRDGGGHGHGHGDDDDDDDDDWRRAWRGDDDDYDFEPDILDDPMLFENMVRYRF